MEQKIFLSKQSKKADEIGEFLVQIGEKLKTQGFFNLEKEGEKIEIKPEGSTKLKLEYEIEEGKHEFEIKIKWNPSEQGEVSIS